MSDVSAGAEGDVAGRPGLSPGRRAVRAGLPFVAVPAVVLGIILYFAVGWIAGLVAFLVVGAGLAAWARLAGDARVAAHLPGREADPTTEARLCNLVEGLSTAVGVRQPHLRVVESDGLNAMAAGTTEANAVLAVTTGLLSELDRIELEAVLAEELYLIRHRETLPATVVVATFGLGRNPALTRDSDARADQGAVSVTRYPPALAAALQKIESKGAVVPEQPAYMAHLWLADPRPSPPPSPGRLALRERIEALREL